MQKDKIRDQIRRVVYGWWAVVLVGLLVGGCTWHDTTAPRGEQSEALVYGSHTVGQTFVCYHAGLKRIGVWLRAPAGSGEVVLQLREGPESEQDLAVARVRPPTGAQPTWVSFSFPVQDDVNGKSMYLFVESPQTPAEAAVVMSYNVKTVRGHQLYVDGVPSPGQLPLQLSYSTVYIVKDLVRQALGAGLRALWLLGLAALFYLLPGGAVVLWLLRVGGWMERLVVALGLSVAIYALLVYATMTGLHLNTAVVLGFLALCGASVVLWVVRAWRQGRLQRPRWGEVWASVRRDPAPVVLLLVLMLVVGVRVFVIRGWVAPRWGDSYQHAVIAQLMIDHGGIFESWAPYAPYAGLSTHFGFHANVAAFHWASGLGTVQAVIWIGQVLNILAVLALYPMGRYIGGRWGGVGAVLVSGLLTTTPMSYVNWGRYPQLAGQVLLPIAGWLLWQVLDRPRLDWRLLTVTVLPTAAQFLAYYRMPYYYAVLVGAWVLCVYVPRFQGRWEQWKGALFKLLLIGFAAGVIVLAWGVHMSSGRLAAAFVHGVAPGQRIASVHSEYEQWRYVHQYVSVPLLVIAGLGLVWAVVRRAGKVVAVGLWGIGMFLLVATRLIGLPGASHLNAFAAMIFVYAPVGLVVGWVGAQVAAYAAGFKWARWGYAALVALLSLWGAYQMVTVSDPGYDLVKPADMAAMAWIRTHTPEKARFLVNGFMIYNGHSIVGSDAGWWIPLLAQRENTMPPQYALLNERETWVGYGQRMMDLVAGLRQAPLSTPDGLAVACGEGVTHVYIGQVEGQVGVPPPQPLFTADELVSDPEFEMLYHQDKVWVFALADGVCHSILR